MYVGKCQIPFNGSSWDDFCQKCFALKYDSEGYQKVPAYAGGDYGIEGFTRSGKVFQSYCPDVHVNPDKLYENQRDKISADILKLVRNQEKLKKCLNGIQIKNWIFYTPDLLHKELVEHAVKKTNEIRQVNCKIITPDFDILIHDFDHLGAFAEAVLGPQPYLLSVQPEALQDQAITDWADTQISLVDNSLRKSKIRLSNRQLTDSQLFKSANNMTDKNIRNFLNGESILRNWYLHFPKMVSTFYSLKGAIEERAEDICITATDPSEAYKSIELMVEQKLSSAFPKLDESTRIRLCSYLMADWILRCPIEFA